MSERAKRSLRAQMPITASFVDACRAAFGKETVDGAIRNGLAGGSDFYARESGHIIGTQCPPPGASFTADQILAQIGK